VAPVYEDGAKTVTLKGDHIADEFRELVEKYVKRSYVRKDGAGAAGGTDAAATSETASAATV
jgi:hypothetical protein